MTTETFSWPTPADVSGTPTFSVLTAQFGDGFKQVAPDGMNGRRCTWTMTFTGTKAEILPIKAFLDRHAAVRSFYWTPPLEEQGLYKGKYTPRHLGGGAFSLSVTMEQDFRP